MSRLRMVEDFYESPWGRFGEEALKIREDWILLFDK
jgi:hypothetical protein